MGKHDVGTPKWISNRIKSKGLQKLRWYCQMCEKQCRDENGFKCHMMSESHQRQLLLFGENPAKYLSNYSKEFEKGYCDILKRQYPGKRVHANVVYQQYIGDKEHLHMNATCWVTLTSFVKHLGRTGKCVIDETEKGWFVTWVEKDRDQLEYEERLAKKDKVSKDDEERIKEYIETQIEKAKAASSLGEVSEATELMKDEDEVVKLDLKLKDTRKIQEDEKTDLKNVFKLTGSKEKIKSKKDEGGGKRKMTALEEIMEEEKRQKKKKEEMRDEMEEKDGGVTSTQPWLRRNIVVKIVTKSLGDKYYKKKGYIKEVIDNYVGLVVMNETGAKLKLDQEHLETVIPGEGREVVILGGKHRGEMATLRSVDTNSFSAFLKLQSTGDKIKLPYEHFSKKYVPSDL